MASGTKSPSLSRRRSIVGETLDVGQLDAPSAPAPKRPVAMKRSLTGTYIGPDDKADSAWPLGDEKAWRTALKTDADVSVAGLQKGIVHQLTTTLARQAYNLVDDQAPAYQATSLTVRDQLIRSFNATSSYHTAKAPKRAYYLSLEFLMGRALDNAVLNLGMRDQYKEALGGLGFTFEDLLDEERDAGLGNGGLGRLAACYVDSFATLDLPAWGYGLRYEYGIFKQLLSPDGAQLEAPDPWLERENPWEIPRLDVTYKVRFYGSAEKVDGAKGRGVWHGGQEVLAVAYDMPIPGHGTKTTANIRLWAAKPITGFDLASFNAGSYAASVEASQSAQTITRVLYPNDSNDAGKELRLKQQYLWCAASLADILRRFKKLDKSWDELPDYVAIQLNDTHPTLAIVELLRILMDEEEEDGEGLSFDRAFKIVSKVFSYTNHTVLPEALEKWPVPLLQNLLPRHMDLIYMINLDFLQAVEKLFPGDVARLGRMSLIEEGFPKMVRMAHLAVIGSHKVNGVAELHSQLVKSDLFPDFVEVLGSDHFFNVTNGITPRRWLDQCNPELSALITKTLGSQAWLKDLPLLKGLTKHTEDAAFRKQWSAIKLRNKERLAELIWTELGIMVPTHAAFDVQIKRIHLYKRQTMNIFGVIARYLKIKAMSPAERKKLAPHVTIFAGKAAPGYYDAKLCIRLINVVSKTVNNDPDIGDLLKCVFIPDYSVSLAEVIIPAADISQQISTAGTEASGTSNMKLALNGALLLGTVDGANVELIADAGDDQCFAFGHLAPDVAGKRHENQYRPRPIAEKSPALEQVFCAIEQGVFGDHGGLFAPLLDNVRGSDYYLVSDDFESYLDAQRMIEEAYLDQESWVKKSIITTSSMGKYSSDNAVMKYAETVWNIEPLKVPDNLD